MVTFSKTRGLFSSTFGKLGFFQYTNWFKLNPWLLCKQLLALIAQANVTSILIFSIQYLIHHSSDHCTVSLGNTIGSQQFYCSWGNFNIQQFRYVSKQFIIKFTTIIARESSWHPKTAIQCWKNLLINFYFFTDYSSLTISSSMIYNVRKCTLLNSFRSMATVWLKFSAIEKPTTGQTAGFLELWLV